MSFKRMKQQGKPSLNGTPQPRGMNRSVGALIAVCGLLVTACGPSVRSMNVDVRDAATLEPAIGVTVFADVPSRDHPFSVATFLKQTGPLSWRARTDGRGVGELKYVPGRPVRVGVLSAGWTVGVVMVEPPCDDSWVTPAEAPGEGARVPQFRIYEHPRDASETLRR